MTRSQLASQAYMQRSDWMIDILVGENSFQYQIFNPSSGMSVEMIYSLPLINTTDKMLIYIYMYDI